MEREKEESIKDFVSKFDLMFRICMAVGTEDMKEIHKGELLMTRTNLEDQEESLLLPLRMMDHMKK